MDLETKVAQTALCGMNPPVLRELASNHPGLFRHCDRNCRGWNSQALQEESKYAAARGDGSIAPPRVGRSTSARCRNASNPYPRRQRSGPRAVPLERFVAERLRVTAAPPASTPCDPSKGTLPSPTAMPAESTRWSAGVASRNACPWWHHGEPSGIAHFAMRTAGVVAVGARARPLECRDGGSAPNLSPPPPEPREATHRHGIGRRRSCHSAPPHNRLRCFT